MEERLGLIEGLRRDAHFEMKTAKKRGRKRLEKTASCNEQKHAKIVPNRMNTYSTIRNKTNVRSDLYVVRN